MVTDLPHVPSLRARGEGQGEGSSACSPEQSYRLAVQIPDRPLTPALSPSPGRGSSIHRWPTPLVEGRLLRRYERFIAEVRLGSGRTVRAHCINSGRMEGMVVPGARVWLSEAPKASRSLKWTWELVELDGRLVGANTALPNALARTVLERGLLSGLDDVQRVRPEQRFGRGHRVDLVLERASGEHWVEVKNCHLVYPDGVGYFPDSNSERAREHVDALARLVKKGAAAMVLFTVQRGDVHALRPSDLHAPDFAKAVRRAAKAGVTFRAVRLEPTLEGIRFDAEIPVDVARYDLGPVREWARALEPTTGWMRKDGRRAGRSVG